MPLMNSGAQVSKVVASELLVLGPARPGHQLARFGSREQMVVVVVVGGGGGHDPVVTPAI